MKKTLAIIIITILSIGIIAPKFVGNHFATTIQSIANEVNSASGYTMEIKSINSSWFSTDALLIMGLESPFEDISLEMRVNAKHGPFLLSENKNLAWLSWTGKIDGQSLRQHLDWSKNNDFFQVKGTISLAGKHDFHNQITAFTGSVTPKKIKVAFSGYQGSGQHFEQELTYHGRASDFTAKSKTGTFSTSNISIDLQIAATLEQILYNGLFDSASSSKINFSSVNITNKENKEEPIIELTDLYVTASSSYLDKESHANMQVSYGVKQVSIDEYSVQDLALEIEVNNINKQFLLAYRKFNQTLANISNEKVQEKIISFAQDNLLILLSTEPQINITSLRGTFPEGKINGTMHTSLVDVSTLPRPIKDLEFWLAHTLINGQITGDKAVIELFAKQLMKQKIQANPQAQDMSVAEIEQMAAQQVPQILEMLAKQGLLVTTDNHYTTDFALKDSQFKVNKKLIPLPF